MSNNEEPKLNILDKFIIKFSKTPEEKKERELIKKSKRNKKIKSLKIKLEKKLDEKIKQIKNDIKEIKTNSLNKTTETSSNDEEIKLNKKEILKKDILNKKEEMIVSKKIASLKNQLTEYKDLKEDSELHIRQKLLINKLLIIILFIGTMALIISLLVHLI